MDADLRRPVERRQHREAQQAAPFPLDPRPLPDVAERVLLGEFAQRRVEGVGARLPLLHVVLAKHAAHQRSAGLTLVRHSDPPSVRCRRLVRRALSRPAYAAVMQDVAMLPVYAAVGAILGWSILNAIRNGWLAVGRLTVDDRPAASHSCSSRGWRCSCSASRVAPMHWELARGLPPLALVDKLVGCFSARID